MFRSMYRQNIVGGVWQEGIGEGMFGFYNMGVDWCQRVGKGNRGSKGGVFHSVEKFERL